MVDMIRREDVPCWYEIGWNDKKTAFVLRIHKDFIHAAGIVKNDAPIVVALMKDFRFKDFSGNMSGDIFGFDGAFKKISESEDFTDFICAVPVTEWETDKKCEYCGGSGQDPMMEWNKCFHCKGCGHEVADNRQVAYALSLSLEVFVGFAFCPEQHTSSKFAQLMRLDLVLSTRPDRLVVGIGGEASVALCKWIRSLGEYLEITESSEAMKSAWLKMRPFSKSLYDRRDYRAVIRDKGFFSMDCPGDACGVFVDRDDMDDGYGCTLGDHNVDTIFQQITLLAGLAALHTKARNEMGNGLTEK